MDFSFWVWVSMLQQWVTSLVERDWKNSILRWRIKPSYFMSYTSYIRNDGTNLTPLPPLIRSSESPWDGISLDLMTGCTLLDLVFVMTAGMTGEFTTGACWRPVTQASSPQNAGQQRRFPGHCVSLPQASLLSYVSHISPNLAAGHLQRDQYIFYNISCTCILLSYICRIMILLIIPLLDMVKY